MPSAFVQSSGSGFGRGCGHQYLGSAGQATEEPAVQADGLLCARRDSGGNIQTNNPLKSRSLKSLCSKRDSLCHDLAQGHNKKTRRIYISHKSMIIYYKNYSNWKLDACDKSVVELCTCDCVYCKCVFWGDVKHTYSVVAGVILRVWETENNVQAYVTWSHTTPGVWH